MNTPTNFNQPSTPPNFGTPQKSGGNNGAMIGMGIAIALLLGLAGYFYASRVPESEHEAALTAKASEYAELDAKYQEAKTALEQQLGINQELDRKIQDQLQQLEASKNEVAGLIRDKKDYKSALANMERQKQQFLAEINDLKRQVGILTETNTQLTQQTEQLTSSLNETQSKLQEESSAKASLISEKTQLEGERQVLSKKVDIASAIRVRNVTVKAVDVRGSKEKSKNKAKKVDKLNICFMTEANEVAPAGEETFYLRIVDPTGTPLAIESLGSGVSTDKRSSNEFRYTTTATTNYSNGETEVCGAWQPGQNFVKGKYTVEVFNKGYLVGTGAFNLK